MFNSIHICPRELNEYAIHHAWPETLMVAVLLLQRQQRCPLGWDQQTAQDRALDDIKPQDEDAIIPPKGNRFVKVASLPLARSTAWLKHTHTLTKNEWDFFSFFKQKLLIGSSFIHQLHMQMSRLQQVYKYSAQDYYYYYVYSTWRFHREITRQCYIDKIHYKFRLLVIYLTYRNWKEEPTNERRADI